MKQLDKTAIVEVIIAAAQSYKENLVGKTFLFVFEGHLVEASFSAKCLKHLTGVESYLSAADFYKHAVDGTIRHGQIFFSSRKPYRLAVKKLAHLIKISRITTADSFLLTHVVTKNGEFEFGATDMSFTLCFDFNRDENGNATSSVAHPESLRDEDCFSRSDYVYEVDCVFSKPNDAKKYDRLEFTAKKDWSQYFPEPAKRLLSDALLSARDT